MELAYQPIVDQTGAIIMAEALLRWQHPTRGALSPGKILQVAESGGLMRELDRYVLRIAAGDAATWQTQTDQQYVPVAVNLSGLLPSDRGFAEEIRQVITDTGLDLPPCVGNYRNTLGRPAPRRL